jgi:hypothetical protein
VRVSGKTGERYLIAKYETLRVLERLHSRQQDIAARDLEAVIGRVDKLLFRNAVGQRPRSFFNRMWAKLMRESGLAKNTAGQGRTLYSLCHTYATEELTCTPLPYQPIFRRSRLQA